MRICSLSLRVLDATALQTHLVPLFCVHICTHTHMYTHTRRYVDMMEPCILARKYVFAFIWFGVCVWRIAEHVDGSRLRAECGEACGRTALHLAAAQGRRLLVQALLSGPKHTREVP